MNSPPPTPISVDSSPMTKPYSRINGPFGISSPNFQLSRAEQQPGRRDQATITNTILNSCSGA